MERWRYLTSAELIHLAKPHGVGTVIRPAGLESAMLAPAASFDGQELHRDIAAKSAALAFAIGKIHHSFVDGNKRAAAIGLLATCWLKLVALILVIVEPNTGDVDDDDAREQIADFVRGRLA